MDNREIDALIAEKVMGWVWVRPVVGTERGDGTIITEKMVKAWLEPVDRWEKWQDWMSLIKDDGKYPRITSSSIPRYSSDIAAAWQVVDKIKDGYFELKTHLNGYKFEFSTFDSSGVGIADTAPMAICLAVLGIKKESEE